MPDRNPLLRRIQGEANNSPAMCSVYRLEAESLPKGSKLAAAVAARPNGPVVRISEQAPVMLIGDNLLSMRWGFRRSFNPSIHNARIERLDSAMWSESLRHRRCLIPLTAYHEWLKQPEGRKIAHQVESPENKVLWAAGLWEETPQDGPCYTMITTAAAPAIAWLHHRMPLLLDPPTASCFLEHSDPPPEPATPHLNATRCRNPLHSFATQPEFDF